MRFPAIACLVALLVVACAHGPRVIKVEESQTPRLDNSHVFYTLPRSLVLVELPVTVRSVERGLLHEWVDADRFAPGRECAGTPRSDINRRLCLQALRPVRAGRSDALFNCPRSGAVVGGPPALKAATRPVADPAHIYAVRMRAGGFETLKARLKLSEHGAPTAFSASGESAWLQVTQYLVGAAAGRVWGGEKGIAAAVRTAPSQAVVTVPTVENTLELIERLQRERLNLARAGTLSQASREVIDAELIRLKQILQGQVVETQVTARLVFDPASATGMFAASQPLEGLCPGKTEGDTTTPEPVIAWLSLQALPGHQAFVDRIRNHTVEPRKPDESGLRYRVPSLATGRLVLLPVGQSPCAASTADTADSCTCEVSTTERRPCVIPAPDAPACRCEAPLPDGSRWVPLESSLTIAQGEPVRSLPRRLGFGSGSLEAELDPASGGLTSVGSDGKGAGYGALGTVVDEAGTDHELAALEREAKLLQQRKSICDSRRALGMSIPEDCNEAKSPGR